MSDWFRRLWNKILVSYRQKRHGCSGTVCWKCNGVLEYRGHLIIKDDDGFWLNYPDFAEELSEKHETLKDNIADEEAFQ